VKRWTLTIIGLLMLGVIVNVAVAWRCYIDGITDQSLLNWSNAGRMGPATSEDIAWVAEHAPRNIKPPTMSKQQTLTGYQLRQMLCHDPAINGTQRYRAGWPMLAVTGEEFRWRPQDATRPHREYRGMVVFRDRMKFMPPSIPYLPVRPVWPGFALNTVFFATIVWLLFAAPFALRRWRRVMRGLCPKCGYDLRGAAADANACPECGGAVNTLNAA
jgi:hypothetical protein